jgi:hypothetical protein
MVLQPGQQHPWELSLSPASSESSHLDDESFTNDEEMDKDIYHNPE